VSEGLDVDGIEQTLGWTAMHAAAYSDSADCIRVLLKNGGDPAVPSVRPPPPLLLSSLYFVPCGYNSLAVFVALTALCAWACVQFTGSLPLHVAASRNAVNATALLVRAGVDQTSVDWVRGVVAPSCLLPCCLCQLHRRDVTRCAARAVAVPVWPPPLGSWRDRGAALIDAALQNGNTAYHVAQDRRSAGCLALLKEMPPRPPFPPPDPIPGVCVV
jgi:ankyrin repeat protein